MPFAIPFYTHLGWGICGQHRIYRLPPGAVFPEEETPASPGKPVGTGGEAVVEAAVTAVTGEEILQEPPVTGRETIPPKPAVIEREPAPDPAVLDRIYRHWSFSLNGCLLRKRRLEGLLLTTSSTGEVWFLKTGAGPTAYALIYPGTGDLPAGNGVLGTGGRRRLLQHLVATTGKPLVWTAPDQALPFSLPGPEEIKPVFLGGSPISRPRWSSRFTRRARRTPGACGWKIPSARE